MLIITQNTETKLSYSKGSHIKICKKKKKKKERMKLRNLIAYRRKNRRRRRRGSGGSSGRPIGANSDPRGGSDSYPPCLASPSSFDSFNFSILYIHTIEPCLLLWFENQIHVFALDSGRSNSNTKTQIYPYNFFKNPNLPFCLTTEHNPLSENHRAAGLTLPLHFSSVLK